MFTTADRQQLLDDLITHARADDAVTAAALVGSGARHDTDQWSDIDLALRLDRGADPLPTADAWSLHLAQTQEVAAHLDVWAGRALYRVFLLADSLQIDLSFWPADDFRSNGEPFDLIFGSDNPGLEPPPSPDRTELIGWAWLYALHTRSAVARGRSWQALQMIDGLRDRIVTLACLRHGLPAHQGRGVDQLPDRLLSALSGTLAATPEQGHITAAFRAAITLLSTEIEHVDADVAERLRRPLATLAETARSGSVRSTVRSRPGGSTDRSPSSR